MAHADAANTTPDLPPLPLPAQVTSRYIKTRDLTYHILEAGHPTPTPTETQLQADDPGRRPLIILLHGFPELAFSWRHVLPLLASAGYYVIAPDQRGFGRTTGWDTRDYETVDVGSFCVTALVRDVLNLVHAVGYRSVRCVVGHDCGAIPAAMCGVIRPDVFESVVLLSHPFNGTPAPVLSPGSAVVDENANGADEDEIHAELAKLGRKHYKWYYSTSRANSDMLMLHQDAAEGDDSDGDSDSDSDHARLHDFLRGYFHLKSGSWSNNDPHPLTGWTASELVKMPSYYLMPLHATMPEAIAEDMTHDESKQTCTYTSEKWLPKSDLAVYTSEYARTGFQGGLNWYRVKTTPGNRFTRDLDVFAGKKIEVPTAFVSGEMDWGTYQEPGAIEKMAVPVNTSGNGDGDENGKNGKETTVCRDFRCLKLIPGVGHWAPQEAPGEVAQAILEMVGGL